jgi:hypothetical protein
MKHALCDERNKMMIVVVVQPLDRNNDRLSFVQNIQKSSDSFDPSSVCPSSNNRPHDDDDDEDDSSSHNFVLLLPWRHSPAPTTTTT